MITFYFYKKLLISAVLVILFYKMCRPAILNVSEIISKKYNFCRNYPLLKITGVINFVLISISNLLLAVILLVITHTSFQKIGLSFSFISLHIIFYGLLLGVGIAGISALGCQLITTIFQSKLFACGLLKSNGSNFSARSTWLKNHHNAKEILSRPVWLLILFFQLFSEEVIFRGTYLNYFLPFGTVLGIMVSAGLFICMKYISMPSLENAVFPMISAAAMGIMHGYLFCLIPTIYPLIISHCVFFVFVLL